jgi:hypothetical protein
MVSDKKKGGNKRQALVSRCVMTLQPHAKRGKEDDLAQKKRKERNYRGPGSITMALSCHSRKVHDYLAELRQYWPGDQAGSSAS